MLNEKMATLADDFLLEKCPVKDSKVSMKITTECLGLKTEDEASIGSNYLNSDNGLTSSSLGFITGDFSNGFKVSPNK